MTSHDQRKMELTNTSKKDEAIHTPSASKLVKHKGRKLLESVENLSITM
ncbi:hypothetical protein ACB092_09G206300 [Castanea dentata]